MPFLLKPPCDKCGARSARRRLRVYFKATGKPAYYCWSCAAQAIEDGSCFTKHIVTLDRRRRPEDCNSFLVTKALLKSN